MSQERTQTTVTQVDPTIQPFLKGGLAEAQRLYGQPAQYYQGATYVGPSESTEAALLAQRNRAIQGNVLNPAAQQQQLGTISGAYLGGNPFFQGAFQGAAQAAGREYNQAVNQALSNASRAGRYGSGAMNTALGSANMALANALSNTAGNLAYQNYGAERARQEAAAAGAPQMAMADYADINQLAQAGQTTESYQQAALQDAINRWNYYQNLPQNQLQQYMGYVFGAPRGSVQSTPVFRNLGGSALGGAATGAALGSAIPGVGTAIGAGLGGILGLL